MTGAKRALFPDPIETDRLLLRSPRPGDGVEVNQAIRESYADLHEWMDWATYLPDVAELEQRKQEARARFLAGEDFQVHAKGILNRHFRRMTVSNKLLPRTSAAPSILK